jgi:ABC-type antimicrobial peptide transport system permease subunit
VNTLLLTLSSLRHRPGRTLLTALGTALGIATIVALLAVAGGAKQSAGEFFHLGASDLGLFQKDAADPTTSVLPTSLIPALRRTRGIAAATALVLLVEDVKKAPGAIVFGADPNSFLTQRLVFTSGHMYRARPSRSLTASCVSSGSTTSGSPTKTRVPLCRSPQLRRSAAISGRRRQFR